MVNHLISLALKIFLMIFIYYFFLGTTYYDLNQAYKIDHWNKVDGQVKKVFIEEDTQNAHAGKKLINTFVSYHYTVDGKLCTAVDMVTVHIVYPESTDDEKIAELEKKKYGPAIVVYYNPADPFDSTVVKPKLVGAILIWASLGIALEILMVFWIFRQFKKS